MQKHLKLSHMYVQNKCCSPPDCPFPPSDCPTKLLDACKANPDCQALKSSLLASFTVAFHYSKHHRIILAGNDL